MGRGEGIDWSSCEPPQGVFASTPPPLEAPAGHTSLSADEAISQAGGESLFRGSVMIQRDAQTLQGDEARYQPHSGDVSVEGNVLFHGEGLIMQGERANMNLQQQQGEFEGVTFHFPGQHAFGSAQRLSLEGTERSTLSGVRYTTCTPGHEDWLLSASELQLDQQSNTGEAYHTVFRFKGVPILYSPYLNFPLAGRKSGLLPPTLGSSDSSGTDIRLPLYWNIAPSYDATLTPRYLSKRGTMLMSEVRLLTENTKGEIAADYLGDDEVYGAERSYLAIDHSARINPNWSTTLTMHHASDALYLEEIGSENEASSTSHLERRFDLNYHTPHWQFRARTQDYQALSGSEPYRRLPQLTLNGQSARRPNRLHYSLQGEAINFDHDTQIPTGTRVDIKPGISLPLQGAAWHLTPSAAWRYTDYSLENYAPGESFTRSLPILSVDGGLQFERETTIGGQGMIQTLEPRLFYLSVPYADQDMLPLFDTAYSSDLSFSKLFSDNRFNGADRVGDTEQLTTALTTRLLGDRDGIEKLRATIGRIHYFRDRQVTLQASEPTETSAASDLFAELEVYPSDRLSLGIEMQYDSENESNEQLNGRIHYRGDQQHQLILDYRYYEPEQLQQSDLVLFWPLAKRWQLLGRWRYDLTNDEDLDVLAGVEYESCCWAIRLLGRNRLTSTHDVDNSIYLTFEFKGLGSLGARLEEALGDDLLTDE